ncbi:MAG: T9SS type A sorting domain-containing protein [Chitinivibrionales bacterium]|nr:T9SS type A sorting domain-containing protein [Chitinivibrionales bacterium]
MKKKLILALAALVILAGVACGAEIIAWDLNRAITIGDNGFPWDYAPPNNTNWVSPVNYAGGMLYYRYIIKGCPGNGTSVNIAMCFHQNGYTNEACSGGGFTFTTFKTGPAIIQKTSEPLAGWWQKPGAAVDWSQPRARVMLAIKLGSTAGAPISTMCCGWNWAGLDPNTIYPINQRFTAVLVAAGSTFSGWSNYPDPADPAPTDVEQTVKKPEYSFFSSMTNGRTVFLSFKQAGDYGITLRNLAGKTLKTINPGSNTSSCQVTLPASGAYIMEIRNPKSSISEKMMVVTVSAI